MATKKKAGAKKKAGKKSMAHLDKWRNHLAKCRKDNPSKTLTQCMKLASKSYKK